LLLEHRQVCGHGKFQEEHRPEVRIRHKQFRKTRVNENGAKHEAANPDDDAAVVEWRRLKHRASVREAIRNQ